VAAKSGSVRGFEGVREPTAPERKVVVVRKRGSSGGAKPGAGRPRHNPAGNGSLEPGETRAIEILNAAIKRFGEDDPLVRLAFQTLIGITSGDVDKDGRPYLRRYVGDRIKSTNALLDRTHGRTSERVPPDDVNKFSDVDKILESLLQDKSPS